MARVTVMVIGGRVQPHFCPVWADPPEIVEMVASNESREQCELVDRVLRSWKPGISVSKPNYVPGTDLTGARDACLRIAQQWSGAELTFDVTSGSKLMSFGAYQAAQGLHCPVIFVDTTRGQILNITDATSRAFRVVVSVEEYLAFWERVTIRKFEQETCSFDSKKATLAARMLGCNPAAHSLLYRMRRPNVGSAGWPCHVEMGSDSVSTAEYGLLTQLQSLRTIANLSPKGAHPVSFTVRQGSDWAFLTGTWLEMFVHDEATRVQDGHAPFFDSVEFNVAVPLNDAEREIDVAMTRNACFIHCSCKSEVRWARRGARGQPDEHGWCRKEHIDELAAVRKLVGDTYATSLYVASARPPGEGDGDRYSAYPQFLQHARQQRIVVITGDQLPRVGEILRLEMLTPTYPRR